MNLNRQITNLLTHDPRIDYVGSADLSTYQAGLQASGGPILAVLGLNC